MKKSLELIVAASMLFHLAGAAGAAVFPVTPGATLDEPDVVPGNGQCRTASGVCTLRAAIQEGCRSAHLYPG